MEYKLKEKERKKTFVSTKLLLLNIFLQGRTFVFHNIPLNNNVYQRIHKIMKNKHYFDFDPLLFMHEHFKTSRKIHTSQSQS